MVDEKTIEKCKNLADYAANPEARKKWFERYLFLLNIKNIKTKFLTVGQRNYIWGIKNEIKKLEYEDDKAYDRLK